MPRTRVLDRPFGLFLRPGFSLVCSGKNEVTNTTAKDLEKCENGINGKFSSHKK